MNNYLKLFPSTLNEKDVKEYDDSIRELKGIHGDNFHNVYKMNYYSIELIDKNTEFEAFEENHYITASRIGDKLTDSLINELMEKHKDKIKRGEIQ